MDIAIILFPGSNREKDMAEAFTRTTGHTPRIVWHKETDIGKPDLMVLPGGFSFGDYLRCGAIAAHSPVMREVIKLANGGTPLLAVCNGFQILVETGLVPGALVRNDHLKFVCRPVHIRLENASSTFTTRMKAGDVMTVPCAHGEGNYTIDSDGLKALNDNGQVAFRYVNSNPNGSVEDIAGVYNKSGTILGMMPHPEDATDPVLGNISARPLFEGILR